jgi:hypothetical protein
VAREFNGGEGILLRKEKRRRFALAQEEKKMALQGIAPAVAKEVPRVRALPKAQDVRATTQATRWVFHTKRTPPILMDVSGRRADRRQ